MEKVSIKSFFYDLFICLCLATFIRWAFFEISTVPTGSMEKTINPEDYIFVSKIHYGPRTPITPLQVPLAHQKTHLFKFKSYSTKIRLKSYRLPGMSKVKINDIVTFNNPAETFLPLDIRTFYVKRCVGCPGDKIQMKKGKVFINDKEMDFPQKSIHKYILTSYKDELSNTWFTRNNITNVDNIGNKKYLIEINEEQKKIIEKKNYFNNISLELLTNDSKKDVFVSNFSNYENIFNWGPVLIPHKGLKIEINDDTLREYGSTITTYDCHDEECKIINSELYINGKIVKEYVFKQDYFFMLGDNRTDSTDSRFFGFVPNDHIYGKIIFVFSFRFLILFIIILFLLFILFEWIKKNLYRR